MFGFVHICARRTVMAVGESLRGLLRFDCQTASGVRWSYTGMKLMELGNEI